MEQGRIVIKRAMHLLEKMDRSEKGLREKLEKSDYSSEHIDAAIEYVKSYGYIDDAKFALNYLRYRRETKSKKVLEQELYQKGIAKDIIREAFLELEEETPIKEKELVRKHVLKKYRSGQELDEKDYRRLQGYLARRGFSWEDVTIVLSEEKIIRKT